MKTIIAATVATLMASSAAMADTLVVTLNIGGDIEVATETVPKSCRTHERELRAAFEGTWQTLDRVTIRDTNNKIVGWSYLSPLAVAKEGFIFTATCIEN